MKSLTDVMWSKRGQTNTKEYILSDSIHVKLKERSCAMTEVLIAVHWGVEYKWEGN